MFDSIFSSLLWDFGAGVLIQWNHEDVT